MKSYKVDELMHLAFELREHKRNEDAKKCYEKALILEPENPGLIKMAAINLRDMKIYDDALKFLEKCLPLYHEKHHVWKEMAFVYEKMAEDIFRDSAVCIISSPLHLWPEWENIKFYYEMAIKCMKKAAEEIPISWSILQYLERYHAFIGNYEIAIEYREKAKKVYRALRNRNLKGY